jgi:hypothetical protein
MQTSHKNTISTSIPTEMQEMDKTTIRKVIPVQCIYVVACTTQIVHPEEQCNQPRCWYNSCTTVAKSGRNYDR